MPGKTTHSKTPNRLVWAIRTLLIASVLFNLASIILQIVQGESASRGELVEAINRNVETMSDLIVDTLGALAISIVVYFLYRDEKKKALKLLHQVFPNT